MPTGRTVFVNLNQDAVNQPEVAIGALATFQADEVFLVLPDQETGSLKGDRESSARRCTDRCAARVEFTVDLDHGDKFTIKSDQRTRCIEEPELGCVDHRDARGQIDGRATRMMIDLGPFAEIHLARPLGNSAWAVRFHRQAGDRSRPFGDVDRDGFAREYPPRGSGQHELRHQLAILGRGHWKAELHGRASRRDLHGHIRSVQQERPRPALIRLGRGGSTGLADVTHGDAAEIAERVHQPDIKLHVRRARVQPLEFGLVAPNIAIEKLGNDAGRYRESHGFTPDSRNDHSNQPPLGIDERATAIPLNGRAVELYTSQAVCFVLAQAADRHRVHGDGRIIFGVANHLLDLPAPGKAQSVDRHREIEIRLGRGQVGRDGKWRLFDTMNLEHGQIADFPVIVSQERRRQLLLLRSATAEDHRGLEFCPFGQLAGLGYCHVAIGHHQHSITRHLDDKARATSFTDLGNFQLDKNRCVLDLVQYLPVNGLTPARGRASK